jgi:hypothetical protein
LESKQVKRRRNKDNNQSAKNHYAPPTAFELVMNLQCELRAEMNLGPLPHWRQTRPTPDWAKNVCGRLRRTILKSVLKLRPNPQTGINWRNYGRCIGIMKRYRVFLNQDIPQMLEKDGLNNISPEKWEKIQPLLGEETAREYYLKLLNRPVDDPASLEELAQLAIEKQLANLDALEQLAYFHVAHQSAKTGNIFFKGISEGFTAFLNEDGEFAGDDRRADIHLELLACQHDIEKMRRSLPQKNNTHLVRELRKLPEFENKSQDWFHEVFKSIKLSIGPRGRPSKFSAA